MKRKFLFFSVILVFFSTCLLMLGASQSRAATPDQIEAAIDRGIAYLATQQNPDGSWGGWEQVAYTGFAVLKMEDRAYELYGDPLAEEFAYHANIVAGLRYICSQVQADGSFYVPAQGNHHANYNTSLAIMALTASRHPELMCSDPTTYLQVVQNAVRYLLAGQNANGGWGYNIENGGPTPTWDWADNSNSGYVTMALVYASRLFGVDIAAALPSLNNWIDFIQTDVTGGPNDGGSGYTMSGEWVNILKTGNLLFQMAMLGDTTAIQRAKDAIAYIARHWNDANTDPGFRNHYQSMFAMMKGLESLGVATIDVGGTDVDWFAEVSDIIVTTQNADGSWPPGDWGDSVLNTSWTLLTLERVVESPRLKVAVDIKPGSCPNPYNSKSLGVIPAAILGSTDFDVSTIDPATVRLTMEDMAGVAPVRWNFEDVATPFAGELCDCHDLNGDGFPDMTLKFDNQAVEAALDLSGQAGTTVPLTITGNLLEEFNNRPFSGKDCMRILK
ncbi:MAG: hypothetical protein A2521_12680 [Deltaproteobacteria bacterium RIFOXYD12_FULL_57_12]|nr:MAG: hypothetical protein A2521_12680 [Deltaproteobacteria bacterium RIFOXYD12_FULL_57_12]